MTIFKHKYSIGRQDPSNTISRAEQIEGEKVQVSIATTLTDFMQATPLLRRVARDTYAPIASDEIGQFLSRLNHGGSGRDTGCVLIARIADELSGFAVLVPVGDDGLELTWMHPGDRQSDLVFDALWDKAVEVKEAWYVRHLQVGIFVPRPIEPTAHAAALEQTVVPRRCRIPALPRASAQSAT